MNREARVTLTCLMTLEPKDLGLKEDCMPYELELAAEEYVNSLVEDISDNFLMPNDIEIEVTERNE